MTLMAIRYMSRDVKFRSLSLTDGNKFKWVEVVNYPVPKLSFIQIN